MINRDNYWAVRDYLDYRLRVLQQDPHTVKAAYHWLKHLLRWADEERLSAANTIKIVYPQYLLTVPKRDGRGQGLSRSGVKDACEYARKFLTWAKEQFPSQFGKLKNAWIDTLRPPRMADPAPKAREVLTLEMVRTELAIPESDLQTRRDKAALAFLYLSGMRANAFCSLTLQCVDIEARTVKQFPTLGVRTKNRKAAVTSLLEIPDLIDVVALWDRERRAEHSPTALWYPTVANNGQEDFAENRGAGLRKGLRKLAARAGVPYLSPHKARHGHAVFGLKAAQTMADYKAVSMNLMHANISITDQIYAVLPGADAQNLIASLGSRASTSDPDLVRAIVQQVLQQMAEQKESQVRR